jgi:hypothetical protein
LSAILYRERSPSLGRVPVSDTLSPRASGPSTALLRHEGAGAQHIAMVDAYRRTGGLVSGAEAALLLRRHSTQPLSLLARWIVTRRMVSYVWQSEILVPLFQFDRDDMSLRRDSSQVVDELVDTFDDWELAAWFARPNSWLQDAAAPVELIDVDQQAVLQAARADRFIARG